MTESSEGLKRMSAVEGSPRSKEWGRWWLPLRWRRSAMRVNSKASANYLRGSGWSRVALDFSQAAQEELAKPAGLFDLAEDRLDDRFPCRIDCPPHLSLKLALHALDPRRIAR